MSAVPGHFMRPRPDPRVRLTLVIRSSRSASPAAEDRPVQTFWHWFAVGVLVFCWVAEATMCALRGF